MIQVLSATWALLIGIFMLMIGNGLQGTLLGLRGGLAGFSNVEMSFVMSAYFLGFLAASRMVPGMIRRVGHVRVFAAMGSTISAVLILYPALVEVWAWTIGRALIGFCFCGVYITAESWLNAAASNENRGKALSLYMIVQMAGIVLAQYVVFKADVSGFVVFIIPSVLVSLAFAPILLSVQPTPAFALTKPLSIRKLINASPLACAGMFLLGGVFAAQFGMSAVYGTRMGLSVGQISLMVSVVYIAALILQYPIGWLSDRVDRRILIMALAAIGAFGALLAFMMGNWYPAILMGAALVGGTSNPLYSLLIAYANDYLDREDMAAASGGLLFINGLGAISGPFITAKAMDTIGPGGFWVLIVALMLVLALYALWRMTQRPTHAAVTGMEMMSAVVATPAVTEMAAEQQASEDQA